MLKVLWKEMLSSVTVQEQHDHQQLNSVVLTRILQQQSEIIQQLSSHGGGGYSGVSQGPSTNNKAIAELCPQQTELLR